ncbi:MAG: ribosomal-processing cysteine protease Prp [Flavonifractor plautii]
MSWRATAATPRQGQDIVCAAVTSAVRLTECAVNDVLGLEASVKMREGRLASPSSSPADWARPTRPPARPFWLASWSDLPACTKNIRNLIA